MSNELERLIRKIKVRIRADDPTVINDALKLAEQYPDEPGTWDVLASAYACEDRYLEAISALARAIAVDPQALLLFLRRGEYELRLENYERAIADFSQALLLSDQQNVDWCRKELHFLRAEALVLSGKTVEALNDLVHVPEDYVYWTVQVPAKTDLLAMCADAVTPNNDGRYQGPIEAPETEEWQLPDEPEEDETALMEILGPEALAKADETLMKGIRPRWYKVSRVVASAIEADDHDLTSAFVCVYLRRLIGLAEAGAIEFAGNIRRPTVSEVRLPQPDE